LGRSFRRPHHDITPEWNDPLSGFPRTKVYRTRDSFGSGRLDGRETCPPLTRTPEGGQRTQSALASTAFSEELFRFLEERSRRRFGRVPAYTGKVLQDLPLLGR
jgi:hypothetical protein